MTRYRLSPEAIGDLDDLKTHLVKADGVRLARHVLAEIRRALNFLAETPEAGHKREDLTNEAVKFWSVFSYMIVYDATSRPLGLARILHGSRDLEVLFRRQPPRI